jgi:hypothetical protein
MAKFYGVVGYAELKEKAKGVWEEEITQKNAYGDIIRNNAQILPGSAINDNVKINNIISIIADPYATTHILGIRYVKWLGILWKVTNIEVQTPRLLLTLGGVYNEQS